MVGESLQGCKSILATPLTASNLPVTNSEVTITSETGLQQHTVDRKLLRMQYEVLNKDIHYLLAIGPWKRRNETPGNYMGHG